ncbi:probable methyltransferase-like protein 15 homolog [Condylostylus longicornis]|uniref:probable methyltransferase-like protein 15 homolog n=1 Tax=Condylostylus longicornis TaxID=2530218 RepID=UPI00244E4800|nr:probable methyltransferase-like protein 15 homolog [Condylostylus longicornis]
MFNKTISNYSNLLFKLNYCNAVQKSLQILEKTSLIPHVPVLFQTVTQYLLPGPNKTIIDMTFGAGGHSKEILKRFENVKIYALDCDPISYNYAKTLQKEHPGQVIPLLGKFSDLPLILKSMGEENILVDGILFDFGCSSMQFDKAERGFSISKNGPLDMRMNNVDPNQLTAGEILSKIDEVDLIKILKIYGEEKQAKKIARSIVSARSLFKINTTKQLADLVESCFNDNCNRVDKLLRPAHSATKTFQALRIFVNNELNEINFGIKLAYKLLKLNGRLVTLTFHSLEDTIVKRHLQSSILQNKKYKIDALKYSSHDFFYDNEILEHILKRKWKQLHKHVIKPNEDEINWNPRSRSAKLRASEKVF